MKTTLLICTMLLVSPIIFAQQPTPDAPSRSVGRYWYVGLGHSSQHMYDEALSLVRYNGSGLAPNLGLMKATEKKYRRFDMQASFNPFSTNRKTDLRPMLAKSTRVNLDYQYLVKAKQWNERTSLYVGGAANLLFLLKRAEQLDNSQLIYDYAFSLAPAAKVDRKLRFRKRDCIGSFEMRVPVLAHIARPYYLNRIEFIDPQNDFLGDLFSNSIIATVDKYLRITTGLSLTYPLFNKNALRIGYNWDFYRLKTINTTHQAEHLISFIFLSNY